MRDRRCGLATVRLMVRRSGLAFLVLLFALRAGTPASAETITVAGGWKTDIYRDTVIAEAGGRIAPANPPGADGAIAPPSVELPRPSNEREGNARRIEIAASTPEAAVGRGARGDELMAALVALSAVFSMSLLQSLRWSAMRLAFAGTGGASGAVRRGASGPADPVGPCRHLVETASGLWRSAETAVLALDPHLPLRALLMNELRHISRRLAASPALKAIEGGAVSVSEPEQYWRMLMRDLNRSIADLKRIVAVAEASRASFGGAGGEPRMPANREEAFFILGANSSVDAETLRRLVRALRQCWHPDLAKDDADRRYREARIRQINVASDIVLQEAA